MSVDQVKEKVQLGVDCYDIAKAVVDDIVSAAVVAGVAAVDDGCAAAGAASPVEVAAQVEKVNAGSQKQSQSQSHRLPAFPQGFPLY